jgi:Zn finger protein HypA/HybF involved in hydrogenase expression
MHEQGIAEDVLTRAEFVAGGGRRVAELRLEVGALAGVTPEGLAAALVDRAKARWGHVPEVVIEMSDELRDERATGVRLRSLTVDG